MTDLTLFTDPYEAEYPSLVREVLNDATRKTTISAAVTAQGKCLLICNNYIYVWTCSSKETGIPHAHRMGLPMSGLKYSARLVCLFSKGAQHKQPSLLAVSPEGNARYWTELGKPHRDESCLLNNEVAYSVQLVDTQEHVHRFLVTTTTGSFHMVDLYHSAAGQPERMATRPLDVGGPGGGIGRRMSLLLFGSTSTEKDQVIKTVLVRGKMGSADVANVLPRYLRFFAIFERKAQLHETDIADLALSKYNRNRERPERRQFRIVDAAQFRSGILLLLVGSMALDNSLHSDRQIFIAYYEETVKGADNVQGVLKTLLHIQLPESLSATGLEKRLSNAHLLVPSVDECAIALSDAFVLVRHPTNLTSAQTYLLESLGGPTEQLLGAEALHGFSHLVLKESGLCTVRRLPRLYDLGFWKKHRAVLHHMDAPNAFPSSEQRLKDAFIEFCAKDIKQAKSILRELFTSMVHSVAQSGSTESADERHERNPEAVSNVAEMALDLFLFLLDRQPTAQEDPRWSFRADTVLSNDQKLQLRELATTKKFQLILRQLGDKLAHYKMLVLFLRTFNLLEWIDHPVQTFQHRSGKSVVAELGEKLVSMIICFNWLCENGQQLPLVNLAIAELAKQHITRWGLPKGNPYLSAVDHVFTKVSVFHELVPILIQASEQTLEDQSDLQAKARVLNEGFWIGEFLVVLVDAVQDARTEEWALNVEDESSTWLNQPDFLTHFVTHLNTALDFLSSSAGAQNGDYVPSTQQSAHIFEQCTKLAEFVLSQQSPAQRNNSKIIARFAKLGRQVVALELAEKYKDFTMLVVYCHRHLDKQHCAKALERYKTQFAKDGFHDFLYGWYHQNKMYDKILAERDERAESFLAQRENINWIRQIAEKQYAPARQTLRKMAEEEADQKKKLIAYSLCKMAALCEDEENVAEIAELSEQIRILHERQPRSPE